MINAILSYAFLQHAIIASIFASIICGIIGVIIVEKKLLMMSGGIAHTALGGVGFGYLCGFEPIFGAAGFSIAAALGIGFVKNKGGSTTDVLIALFWSLGMALGIVFIALTPGYPPNVNSYLFGNILSVTKTDLSFIISMCCIVCFVVFIFFDDWKAWLFDEEFSFVSGLSTRFFENILLILVALSVVALIRVAGIIMVIALLTAPAASASLCSKKLKNRMILSSLIGILCCFAGLWISYTWNIASGAVIIMFSVVFYFLCLCCKKIILLLK